MRRLSAGGSFFSNLVASSTLLFNTFIWFYLLRAVMNNIVPAENSIMFFVFFDSAVILSSLLGAFVAGKAKRAHMLFVWMILGILAPVFALLLDLSLLSNLAVTGLFAGFSFGFGMPSALALFADSTTFENRGRAGGFLFMLSNLVGFLFLLFLGDDVFWVMTFTSAWRVAGLVVLLAAKPQQTETEAMAHSFRSILGNRTFVLYILPWLLFSLVDNIEKPYGALLVGMSGSAGQAFLSFDEAFELLIGTVFAFVGGFVADRVGRKRVVLYGFIALGIAFAAMSVAPTFQAFWYVTSAVDGIAWGIFYVMFVLVLWGDLSPANGVREKYFALGSIPFFLAELVGKIVYPFAQNVSTQTIYAAFPLASFFLFLAVIPLMLAPETLPEKQIRERELKDYVEKARKVKEKYG